MSYWEKYRKASFRGVEFWPIDGDAEHGRRIATHEYPLRDIGLSEDLGKRAALINLQGRVVGEDFLGQAQRLIEACNKPGPGALVHPLFGTLQVVCKECRPNWTLSRKGEVVFSLSFMEEGENRYPADNADYAELAAQKAEASLGTFQDLFGELIDLRGPGWISDALAKDLKVALDMIAQVVSVAAPGGGASAALDIVARAQALASGSTAGQSVGSIVGLGLGALRSLANDADPAAALWAALEVSSFGALPGSSQASIYGGLLTAVSQTTAARQTQAANRQAFTDLVRRLAVTHGIQAALDMELDNYQQAQRVSEQILTRLDELMLEAGDNGDDEGFRALRTLQVEVIKAFEQKGASLQPLVKVPVPPAVTSSFVMAAELYGDPSRADEIMRRNPGVMHPAFLPSGDELEVLRA